MSFLNHNMQPCDPYHSYFHSSTSPVLLPPLRALPPSSTFISHRHYHHHHAPIHTSPTSKTTDGYLGYRQNLDGTEALKSSPKKKSNITTFHSTMNYIDHPLNPGNFYFGEKINPQVPRKKGTRATVSPPSTMFPILNRHVGPPPARILHFTDHPS